MTYLIHRKNATARKIIQLLTRQLESFIARFSSKKHFTQHIHVINSKIILNKNISSLFSDASSPSTSTGSPVPEVSTASEASTSSSSQDESKLSLAAALENNLSLNNSSSNPDQQSGIETDLRKSLVKSRLGQVILKEFFQAVA